MRFHFSVMLLFSCITTLPHGTAQAASVNDFVDFSSSSGSLPGRLYVPPEAEDLTVPRPIILFLHGAGETGSNNISQIDGNIDNLLDAAKQRGAFLYAPQAANFGWENQTRTTNVMSMIDLALAEQNADPNRLYVTGLSMGGGGTWNMLSRFSDRFAAGVPIAGVGPAVDFRPARLVAKPIWAFHARNDGVVSKDRSRNVVNSILSSAGEPTLVFPPSDDTSTTFEFVNDPLDLNYTEWPTGGHGIWPRVYDTTEMYDWMFSHQAVQPPPPAGPGDYNGSGMVEQQDLDLVLMNWGAFVGARIPGWGYDGPTDGYVDQNDLDRVLLNWGNTSIASSVVPEPTSLMLVLAGFGIICVTQNRKIQDLGTYPPRWHASNG